MHKRRLNELMLDLVIEPAGPLLIKSGVESGADPTLPSMNFVRTRHPTTGETTIYLPGSSLKGAMRSHVERIIRTVHGDNRDICCDPLGKDRQLKSCDQVIRDENRRRENAEPKEPPLTTAEEYRRLCLACRLFGHTVHAGHLLTADACPPQPLNVLPVRHQVAIDRLSGGVAVGPFDLEVALEGCFETRLTLVNYELWQVGLLALALRDMAEGRLLLGYGKSRGLGRVRVRFTRLELAYPGRFDAADLDRVWYGVGALAEDMVESYNFVRGDKVEFPRPGALAVDSVTWGRPAITFGLADGAPAGDPDAAHTAVRDVLAAAVPAWAAYQP